MIGLVGLAFTAVLLGIGAPWWLLGLFGLPAVLWGPGLGWARWLRQDTDATALQLGLDAAWIGMALAWVNVALIREVGLRDQSVIIALLVLSGAWSLTGLAVSWRRPLPRRPPSREWLGIAGVVVAVVCVAAWRVGDVTRPLDAYWYLEGAADEGHEIVRLDPAQGFADRQGHGWDEAGAWSASIESGPHRLVAPRGAQGRVLLAVRGPLGSQIQALDEINTVEADMTEEREEGPVRRYLEAGVAVVAVDLDLDPGETLELTVSGERLYVMPGTEAVWSMHADGALRFVHYYQLLNQVENQDWANEVLVDRRFTWNQPPGWSPLLAVATILVMPDLPGANVLFLWVLLLVGLSSVRLASLLAPGAPVVAWAVPGGMAASHGLLMFEPMSANFPDSLYAAAVLYVGISLASGRTWGFALAGMLTGMLRWPGIVLATLFAGLWRVMTGEPVLGRLLRLWGLTLLGAAAAGLALVAGDAEDLLFILYFETFPEHWHGDYAANSLLPRIPEFYLTWLRYTGGGLALAAMMAIGPVTRARRQLWFVLGGALLYSLVLCTIDHHPTHYFLPLVALTGTAVVIASSLPRHPVLRVGLSTICLVGLWMFLRTGQV